MILEGLFRHGVSIYNLTQIDPRLGTLPQTQQLITDSHQAGINKGIERVNKILE